MKKEPIISKEEKKRLASDHWSKIICLCSCTAVVSRIFKPLAFFIFLVIAYGINTNPTTHPSDKKFYMFIYFFSCILFFAIVGAGTYYLQEG